ncbi:chitin disaccharide deacetylase [Brevibacillus sp. TJ4]|uniref:chitin disaccharide deacetylase n=1 Tax=Brevibacillus sp. TJ4 TaxID=3234853 RepID=UPI003BA2E0D2
MKLIVNADDFGYCKGVNDGIVEAYRNGVVSSATLMVNMPGFAHAIRLAKENPGLGTGVHLVLTCGKPVCPDVPSLTDSAGCFPRGQDHLAAVHPDEVEREFSAQIERFLQAGLRLSHLDSHHHVHAQETILPVVLRLAERYRVPVRQPWPLAGPGRAGLAVRSTEGFSSQFYGDALSEEAFLAIVETLRPCATAEIMCHPGYEDEYLLANSAYVRQRVRELQILTSTAVKARIANSGIELVTFQEIG